MLSKHPDVVRRLFSETLSLDGKLQALEVKFWNRLEYVPPKFLGELWEKRSELEVTTMGAFALVANEFANGDIGKRPWGAILSSHGLLEVLCHTLSNTGYLVIRTHKIGSDEEPIVRALGYLILVSLQTFGSATIAEIFKKAVFRDGEKDYPDNVKEMLFGPVVGGLIAELQDVCEADCGRIHTSPNGILHHERSEIASYWARLDPTGESARPDDNRRLIMESHTAPCKVGYELDENNGCPLFGTEIAFSNLSKLLEVAERVSKFRHAAAKD